MSGVSNERAFHATAVLLGETPDELDDELARAASREARARVLAREATAILVDVAALELKP